MYVVIELWIKKCTCFVIIKNNNKATDFHIEQNSSYLKL